MKVPHLSELRKEYDRSSSRVHWLVRIILWCSGLWVVWVALGFLAIPPIVRSQLEKRLSAELHRAVTVQKVRLNPIVLSLSIEGFQISEPDGSKFVGWDRFYANFDSFSFLLRQWRFQQIELTGFSGRVAVAKEGKLNFSDLLETLGKSSASPQRTPSKPWPLSVRRLAVDGAQVSYYDDSQDKPFETHVGPTTFRLRDFFTGGEKNAPGEFSATTESGETFSWRGLVRVAPLRSSGEVRVGQIALKKYAPFYARRVRFDVLDGQLDIALKYEFAVDNGKPSFRASEGQIGLNALKIAKRGESESVISLDKVEVADVSGAWPALSAEVARVAISGGSVHLVRDSGGIDLVSLLTPVAEESKSSSVVVQSSGPQATDPIPAVKVGAVTVRALGIIVDDETTPRPVHLEFTDLSCDLRNFSSTSLVAPMPIGLRVRPSSDSEVHLAGTVSLAPIKAQLGVELTHIPLALFSAYAETFVNVRVGGGYLTSALYLGAELPPEARPILSAQGDLTVSDFAAHDAAAVDEIIVWRSLAIRGLEYSSEPEKLIASEIAWTEPSAHLIVDKNGVSNLASALKSHGDSPAPASVVVMPKQKLAAPTEILGGMNIALDRFILEKASLDFTDRSLQPSAHVVLNQFSGQIEGLASSDLARASVDLRGRIEGVAPLVITGKTNPLSVDAFTDLKLTLKAMELVPFGPYLGKFAGYELEKGSLSLDIKCNINKRKLKAAIVADIDQFTFGDATHNPAATSLPVRLAVKLLKDPRGKIILDPPIEGSIDDPEVRTGRIIVRVITNILKKVALAPFSFIASAFGGEKGVDPSFQKFLPGENTPVDEAEIKKLDVVARAMKERPELLLEIAGGFDEAIDAPALRDQTLEMQMKNIIWNDKRMIDPEVTLDQIEIDPVQRNGMTRRLFYKAFPKEKPKRLAPGDPGYTDEVVVSQKGNLGAFQRKKKAVAPVPAQRTELTGKTTTAEGTTETTSELKEVKPPTFEEMKTRLLALIVLDEDAFRKLADERANAVRQYLINYGEVPPERLSVAPITENQPAVKGTRVELRLK
ncbi:MAG: DUF748 domain-containing protein [Nibricoccus sp.]